MKRSILALLAATMLTVPAAYAGPFNGHSGPARVHGHAGPSHAHRHVVKKRVVVHRWNVGKRVPVAQRRVVVTDYGRHHLRRPGRGQHWVKVDNDYLLVGIASGLVAALVTAQ